MEISPKNIQLPFIWGFPHGSRAGFTSLGVPPLSQKAMGDEWSWVPFSSESASPVQEPMALQVRSRDRRTKGLESTAIKSVCLHVCELGHVRRFASPLTVAHQAPLSMGFSRQDYWSELPFPPPGDLPDTGIEPTSPEFPALQADSLPLSHQGSSQQLRPGFKPWLPHFE